MRVRLAVAAAVLVGGGAVGVVAIASHGSTAAKSAGYTTTTTTTTTTRTLSESEAMSAAMNWWNRSPQTSLTVITEMVTIRTVSTAPLHSHTLAVQRGVVVAKAPWEFVVKSSNGQIEIWHANSNTKFLNVGGNKTGWNAMTGGTMSSYGSYNWSNMSNSKWNMSTKTPAVGDLEFVFGERVHGELWAQLVLFAAPGSSIPTPQTPPTSYATPSALPTSYSSTPATTGNSHW